jgi:hypothetical protein
VKNREVKLDAGQRDEISLVLFNSIRFYVHLGLSVNRIRCVLCVRGGEERSTEPSVRREIEKEAEEWE